MRRTPVTVVALLAGLALAAGCGGGGDDEKADGGGTTATASETSASQAGDAVSVLSSIKTDVATAGPMDVEMTMSIGVTGTPTDPTLTTFLAKPVTLSIKGTGDSTAKKTDVSFSVAAGPISLTGQILQDGDKGYLNFNGKWYELPAAALSQATGGAVAGGSVDTQKILQAFGSPSALVQDAKLVGTEDVGGVESDHVSGTVDVGALIDGITKASSAAGTTTSPVSPQALAKQVGQIEKYIKNADVDVWVGREDKALHRLAIKVDGTTDDATKTSSGIEGFDIDVDLKSVPGETPSITAPANAAPLAQLQADLGGLFGGLAGTGTS